VQLKISASECKGFGNIPGSHFVSAFSAPRRIHNDVNNITKARFFNDDISRRNR
jgi:hypothetical protein